MMDASFRRKFRGGSGGRPRRRGGRASGAFAAGHGERARTRHLEYAERLEHFEQAIELSGGRDLMAKVLLASEYARMAFDRDLHDRLCREVLGASPEAPGLTLSNTLAQERAQRLLDSSDDYFGE